MKEKIVEALNKIIGMEDITIIYACESGSRSWGFESTDSDYDVRFIYARKPQDYFSVFPYRDVIDRNKGNEHTSKFVRSLEALNIDIVGFDIKKVMKLVSNCNPGISEWLLSYCIYMEFPLVWTPIKQMSQDMFRYKAAMNHYVNLAKTHYEDGIKGNLGDVVLKKYLYVMRALLSCQYISIYKQYPPANISELFSNPRLCPEDDLMADCIKIAQNLVIKKTHSGELSTIPHKRKLNALVKTMIDIFMTMADEAGVEEFPQERYEQINRMFYDIVMRPTGVDL